MHNIMCTPLSQDLTEKCERPNVMDIKIGSRTYGPDAPEQKRAHEDAKYPGTKQPLGFSVLGIIVNPRDGGDAVKYDRSFGRNLRQGRRPGSAFLVGLSLYYFGRFSI